MTERDDPETPISRNQARGHLRVVLPDEPPTLTPPAARALLRLVKHSAVAGGQAQKATAEQHDDRKAA